MTVHVEMYMILGLGCRGPISYTENHTWENNNNNAIFKTLNTICEAGLNKAVYI